MEIEPIRAWIVNEDDDRTLGGYGARPKRAEFDLQSLSREEDRRFMDALHHAVRADIASAREEAAEAAAEARYEAQFDDYGYDGPY